MKAAGVAARLKSLAIVAFSGNTMAQQYSSANQAILIEENKL